MDDATKMDMEAEPSSRVPAILSRLVVMVLVVCAALLMAPAPAHAENVCQVGTSTYASIAEAVDGNTGTFTIEMLASYEVPSTITIPSGKTVTLQPATGVTSSTLTRPTSTTDASSMFSVEAGATFTIAQGAAGESMVLDGSDSGASGSSRNNRAIVNAGTLTVDGATIENFRYFTGTSYNGGSAIYSTGDAVLTGATLIQANDCSSGVQFTGGAVFTKGGTLKISGDASIAKNTSHDGGGLVVSGGAKVTMDGGSITGNVADYPGGGIYLYNDNAANSFTMTGGEISGNYSTSNYGGGGIFAHSNTTVTITGGSITGNGATATGGGVDMYSTSAKINISGNPIISGNVQGATWDATNKTFSGGTASDVYLTNTTGQLTVRGDLTAGAKVGVLASNSSLNAAGKQFGVSTAADASTVGGLFRLFNDVNTGDDATDLYGLPGTGNQTVWGRCTCQIIREVNGTPTLIGLYPTLAEATAAAEAGDTIEVYRSHEVTSTATLAKEGVTITTAPTTTASATGAHLFSPASGETSTATVTRSTELATGTSLLDVGVTATGTVVSNLSISGNKASASAPCVNVAGSLTMVDATVVSCINTAGTGAVNVSLGGGLTVSGGVGISGNKNSGGSPNNVYLADADGIIKIDNATKTFTGSSVGVTVATSTKHVAYHTFAQATTTDIATTAKSQFFDDRNPTLAIGANNVGSTTDLDTYLYFVPPTDFSFHKVSSDGVMPASGATFVIYQYTGGTALGDTYVSVAAMEADPADWKLIGTYTSDADGLVTGAALDDGTFCMVETSAPADHATPTGEWQIKVDSTQPDTATTNKFVFTTIANGTVTTPDFVTTADAAGEYSVYTVSNGRTDAALIVSKTTSGDYADKTKAFALAVTVSDTTSGLTFSGRVRNADGSASGSPVSMTSGTPTTFNLSDGQYVEVGGGTAATTYSITESDSTGYTVTTKTTTPANVSSDASSATTSGTLALGITKVAYTNTKTEVEPTGLKMGDPAVLLVAGCVCGALMVLLASSRFHRRHSA